MSEVIAANITRLMGERGVNASQLARDANRGQTAVYDILYGRSKNPRIDMLDDLARALHVPLSDLFLTESQVKGMQELMAAYLALPDGEQTRLRQIAQAWMPDL